MFVQNAVNNYVSQYVNKNAESYKRVKRFGKIGGGMAGGGGAVMLALPVILNFAFGMILHLEEGGFFTNMWSEVPIALTTNVYIFNLDNPEEFANGAKPRLTEMGPYSFKTYLKHDVISYSDDGERAKYYISITWVHDPEHTKGSLDDKITMLNMVSYAGAGLVQNVLDRIPLSFALAPVVYGFMNVWYAAHGEGLIKETTARDLLEGKVLGMIETIDNLVVKPMRWVGLDIPYFQLLDMFMAENKFGLLHLANGTKLGPYEVYTGKSDFSKTLKVISFLGQTTSDFFDDRLCNMINGSEPITQGTYIEKDHIIYVFFACRPLAFTYDGPSFVKGSPQWGFRMAPEFMAGPKKNPNNKCFCTTPEDPDWCDGIWDLGPCAFLAPAGVTYPHFLYAGDKIKSTVIGMRPDPAKHEARLEVNPTLGAPVDAKIRVQANLYVRSHSYLYGFGDLPKTVYPLVWVELGIFPEGLLNWIMAIGLNFFAIIDWGPYLLFNGGLGVLGYTSYVAYKDRNRLFKRNGSLSQSLERLDPVDRQMETKARSQYPNLFTVSDGVTNTPTFPPAYESHPRHIHRQVQTLANPQNETEQKRLTSPPGAVE